MISKCEGCQPHKFQDAKHGPGMRVFNKRQAKGLTGVYRCTICTKEKSIGSQKPNI